MKKKSVAEDMEKLKQRREDRKAKNEQVKDYTKNDEFEDLLKKKKQSVSKEVAEEV